MALQKIQLRIDTPTGPTRDGRGFYQLDEESLFVQIGIFSEKKHFFNYLENDIVLLDLDRIGQLIFIEIYKAKRHWIIDDNLTPPPSAEIADIRWLNFREQLPPAEVKTNQENSIVKIQFHGNKKPLFYIIADSVIAETNHSRCLTAIWVMSYAEDAGGKNIKKFRQKLRRASSYLG